MSKFSKDDLFEKPDESFVEHFVAAAGYTRAGLAVALRQQAVRMELFYTVFLQCALLAAGAGALAHVVAFVLAMVLFAVEVLNTAIENIVDRMSPERSQFAKETKDLGSSAVFCVLVANGVYAGYAVIAALV